MSALALALVACDAGRIVAPMVAPSASPLAPDAAARFVAAIDPAGVRISEFHYDNPGTDVGEAIEISAPVGTVLTGWSVVRYNGALPAAAVVYSSPGNPILSGVVTAPATACGNRGVVVLNYPTDGLQNGAPDGFALVNPANEVVEFLSYEGVMTAAAAGVTNAGPAAGMTSTDVGISETAATIDATSSLQRVYDATTNTFSWKKVPRTFGSCNDDNSGSVPAIVASVSVSPATASINAGATQQFTATGFDATNASVPGTTFTWSSSDADVATVSAAGLVTGVAPGPVTITATSANGIAGTASMTVNTPAPAAAIALSPATWTMNTNATRQLVASATDANGAATTTTYTYASSNEAVATVSATGLVTGTAVGTATITATSANGLTATSAVTITEASAGSVTIPSVNNLIVGYTEPLFPVVKDASGKTIVGAALTYTSADPSVVTVDARGYVTGTGPGSAAVRATAASGAFGSTTVTILAPEPLPAGTIYRDHLAFGEPAGTPADEVRLNKTQFVISYNKARGGPNWVSWNLNGSQFGNAPRCNCFTSDATLPGDVYHVVDFDYRNGGYDRGHMAQSESRTSTFTENSATFLLTNILPQGAENNQGPWSKFENYVNDLVRTGGREGYVIAGGEYAASPGTLKNEGHVAIPDYTWKIVVLVGAGQGIADVHSTADLQVIAIKMPNLITTGVPASSVGMRNNPWDQYKVTVDQLESELGMDFLTALPDSIQRIVESGDRAPSAAIAAPVTSVTEGGALSFAGSGLDPDGDAISYEWSFGDGSTASGANVTHTFADNGSYTVKLVTRDPIGATGVATVNVTVANVAPSATFAAPASALEGTPFTVALGSVVDPSPADLAAMTYSFDCGLGAGFTTPSATASASCTAPDNGALTVRARISDGTDVVEYTAAVAVANVPPTATLVTSASSVVEGSGFTLSLAGLADASSIDLASLTATFDCGTGTPSAAQPASGATVTCATTDDGVRTVRAVVTDKDGGAVTLTGSVTVTNAAPVVGSFAGAGILRGEHYAAAGAFTDVGADSWTATVNYGDGTGEQSLGLSGTTFALSHDYLTAGTFTVTVTVRDDDGGTSQNTAVVTVASASSAIGTLQAQVAALAAAGTISTGEANALDASLRNALRSVDAHQNPAAANQLEAFINKVAAAQRSGRLSAADADALTAYAQRVIASIG